MKEREVAEKLQEAELKERAEKLREEKIREMERLQEEAQLKCKNMLDAAELEAQRILSRAQKYSDLYVEQVVNSLEEQIKKQMEQVMEGRGQIADVMKKINRYR